ncbi:hypothetical protein EV421DRAFT_1916997 [Armillaria borealis]|uniref:Uncharacterized protein n=1 Tax=Armillaria borealis TaxID=47425 RepID=A0AA39IBV1_9AGAR|nr:hypothetical protein EV421DRAFT_1916997 [Armillaria borealis]
MQPIYTPQLRADSQNRYSQVDSHCQEGRNGCDSLHATLNKEGITHSNTDSPSGSKAPVKFAVTAGRVLQPVLYVVGSQALSIHRQRVTKFALEKEEGYGKEAFVLCRSRFSSPTLLHHWITGVEGPSTWTSTPYCVLRSNNPRYNRLSSNGLAFWHHPTKIDPPSVIIFETMYSHLKSDSSAQYQYSIPLSAIP